MKKPLLVEITILLLIIIFFYTGFSKLIHHRDFIYSIGWWKPLRSIAVFISFFIPGVQLLMAVLFFFERFRKIALTGSACLMLLFVTYIVFMKVHESNLPCSCGGIIASLTWNEQLVINICLLLLCIISLLIICKQKFGLLNNRHSVKDSGSPATGSGESDSTDSRFSSLV